MFVYGHFNLSAQASYKPGTHLVVNAAGCGEIDGGLYSGVGTVGVLASGAAGGTKAPGNFAAGYTAPGSGKKSPIVAGHAPR